MLPYAQCSHQWGALQPGGAPILFQRLARNTRDSAGPSVPTLACTSITICVGRRLRPTAVKPAKRLALRVPRDIYWSHKCIDGAEPKCLGKGLQSLCLVVQFHPAPPHPWLCAALNFLSGTSRYNCIWLNSLWNPPIVRTRDTNGRYQGASCR